LKRVLALVLALGCSKGKADDCAIVRDKPGEAMVELTKRYPKNPVKVAQTIESCVAPSGDECERVAKIITAIPTMAPQLTTAKLDAANIAKTCREAPPEFRRCLLPSYGLAHAEECREVVTRPIETIEIAPRGPEHEVERCGGFVSIYIDEDGTWLATGRDSVSWCFTPRKDKELDHVWLEAQLRGLTTLKCPAGSVELAAHRHVPYRDVIATMDVSIKAGLMDVGLSSPEELAVPLAKADSKNARRSCPASVIPPDPAPTPPAPRDPQTSGTDRLKNAPVVIVTKLELTLEVGDKTTPLGFVDDVRKVTGKLDALVKALPPARDGMLILQADESTPADVINLVIISAKTAGYNNLLFAVKNR
jgi:biopolymer transport protein ExbD